MPQQTDQPFDGVLSGVRVGLTSGGVALNVELTSLAGEEVEFIARLFPEDARRLSAILSEAATAVELGEPITGMRQ